MQTGVWRTSLTVHLQNRSDRPRELRRLLSQRRRRPGTLLVASRETLRRRPDFNVSRAAETEWEESAKKNYTVQMMDHTSPLPPSVGRGNEQSAGQTCSQHQEHAKHTSL